jgi:hypothetical protein
MKLANKYELFDPVTTGKVEAFVARDLAKAEPVVVYIFEGGPPPSDPPTIEWALEAFCGVAPAPPGEVIDVGRYGGTAFAYLVTKVPEAEELQKWVAAYESYVEKTQEIALSPAAVASSGAPSETTAQVAAPEPDAGASGSITGIFSPPAKPAGAGPASPVAKDTKSVPAPVPERVPTRPKESFTGIFQSAGMAAEPTNAGARGNEGKAGDFTSFFQGPFTGKAPSSIPDVTPHAPEQPRPGEFTAIFGRGREHPQEAADQPSVRSDTPLNEPGGFTQLFASPAPAQTPAGYESPAFLEDKPVKSENTLIFDKPGWESQTPVQPQMPAPSKNPFESLPAVSSLPVGSPSEYTMIVSGGRASNPPDEPPIAGGTNPPGAAGFAMPKAPVLPAVAAPKIPAAPQMPKVAAPKIPDLAAPKAPQAPDVPKPPVSYLPLILILTVLFFVAAMLVLYFALKH